MDADDDRFADLFDRFSGVPAAELTRVVVLEQILSVRHIYNRQPFGFLVLGDVDEHPSVPSGIIGKAELEQFFLYHLYFSFDCNTVCRRQSPTAERNGRPYSDRNPYSSNVAIFPGSLPLLSQKKQ